MKPNFKVYYLQLSGAGTNARLEKLGEYYTDCDIDYMLSFHYNKVKKKPSYYGINGFEWLQSKGIKNFSGLDLEEVKRGKTHLDNAINKKFWQGLKSIYRVTDQFDKVTKSYVIVIYYDNVYDYLAPKEGLIKRMLKVI